MKEQQGSHVGFGISAANSRIKSMSRCWIKRMSCFHSRTISLHHNDFKFNDGNIGDDNDCYFPFYDYGLQLPPQLSADDEEVRCSWLRSQIIGSNAEVHTPFGWRRLVYADYTASGRCVQIIEHFIAHRVLPYYGNTHAEDSFVGQTMSHMVAGAAEYVKRCMGATDSESIIFCGSGCTEALKRLQEVMGIVVPSILRDRVLKVIEEKERWVVFVGPYEHHSNLLSWRQSLAEVVEVPLNLDGLIDTDYLKSALTDPKYIGRPKLGSFSACSNVTGVLTDTRHIAKVLHDHGALACFDFASSGSYVEIDMRGGQIDGYDAIVLSPHKFVGGPGTPGILILRNELYLLKDMAPSTAGGGVVEYVNGFEEKDTIYVSNIEAREEGGTPPIIQTIKCALAFWLKDKMNVHLVECREDSFISRAISRLSRNSRVTLLGNTKVKRAAILSFLIYSRKKHPKVLHGRFTVRLLHDLFGMQTRGGCSCAAPYGHALLNIDHERSIKFRLAIHKGYLGIKPGWTRLNFPYFISEPEFEFLLSAIEFVIEYGELFIPLYDFDWRTGNWEIKRAVAERLLRESILLKEDQSIKRKNGIDQEWYTEYIEFAKVFAEHLGRRESGRKIPLGIDPALVYFII